MGKRSCESSMSADIEAHYQQVIGPAAEQRQMYKGAIQASVRLKTFAEQ